MSGATAMAIEDRTLTGTVAAVLEVLTGDVSMSDARVRVKSSDPDGFTPKTAFVRRASPWLPEPILTALERRDSAHVGPVLCDAYGAPRSLHALVAVWSVPADLATGRPNAERVAAIEASLAGFPNGPTVVVYGSPVRGGSGYQVQSLWRLVDPLDLTAPEGDAHARAALEALAARLNADAVPVDLRDLVVSVPGCVLREGTCRELARATVVDPERRYTLAELSTTPRPAGRNRGQAQ